MCSSKGCMLQHQPCTPGLAGGVAVAAHITPTVAPGSASPQKCPAECSPHHSSQLGAHCLPPFLLATAGTVRQQHLPSWCPALLGAQCNGTTRMLALDPGFRDLWFQLIRVPRSPICKLVLRGAHPWCTTKQSLWLLSSVHWSSYWYESTFISAELALEQVSPYISSSWGERSEISGSCWIGHALMRCFVSFLAHFSISTNTIRFSLSTNMEKRGRQGRIIES